MFSRRRSVSLGFAGCCSGICGLRDTAAHRNDLHGPAVAPGKLGSVGKVDGYVRRDINVFFETPRAQRRTERDKIIAGESRGRQLAAASLAQDELKRRLPKEDITPTTTSTFLAWLMPCVHQFP